MCVYSAGAPPPTRWQAAHAAALLLARTDAGVLDGTETNPVAAAVTAVLGEDTLNALRGVWREAHATGDTDTKAMLRLGRRWCRIIGTDPDTTRPPEPPATGSGDPSPLAEAVASTVAAVTAADSPPPLVDPGKAAERAAENTARRRATTSARAVFKAGGVTGSRITGTRPPAPAEQAAARRLTRALRQAAARERTATTLTSPTPPGRLRMRATRRGHRARLGAAGAAGWGAGAGRPLRRAPGIVQLIGRPVLELLRELRDLLGRRDVQLNPDALTRAVRPLDPPARRRCFTVLVRFLADVGQAHAARSQIGQQRRHGPPQHCPLGIC